VANGLQTKSATATIPVRAAKVYATDLKNKGGELNDQVASALLSQISVTELMGQRRVDVDPILISALATSEEPEVDTSIDSLIDLVIDLRR